MMLWFVIGIMLVYLGISTYYAGGQESLSAMAGAWKKWPFMLTMAIQGFCLPSLMIGMTGETCMFLPFFMAFGILLVGATPLMKESLEEKVHYLGAFLSGIAGAVWVGLNNWILLLPALICILAGGKENLKWRTEIGLIISVYLVLCLK